MGRVLHLATHLTLHRASDNYVKLPKVVCSKTLSEPHIMLSKRGKFSDLCLIQMLKYSSFQEQRNRAKQG